MFLFKMKICYHLVVRFCHYTFKSSGWFVSKQILCKCTYIGHFISDVSVPARTHCIKLNTQILFKWIPSLVDPISPCTVQDVLCFSHTMQQNKACSGKAFWEIQHLKWILDLLKERCRGSSVKVGVALNRVLFFF